MFHLCKRIAAGEAAAALAAVGGVALDGSGYLFDHQRPDGTRQIHPLLALVLCAGGTAIRDAGAVLGLHQAYAGGYRAGFGGAACEDWRTDLWKAGHADGSRDREALQPIRAVRPLEPLPLRERRF